MPNEANQEYCLLCKNYVPCCSCGKGSCEFMHRTVLDFDKGYGCFQPRPNNPLWITKRLEAHQAKQAGTAENKS